MGKFVVTVRKNGEFQFNLKATNGQVILTSEGYNTKAACMNGIESVKKNGPLAERYEIKVAKNGKPFFNLKASNGQVIGSSQMYASERTMKAGIASVMRNAADSAVAAGRSAACRHQRPHPLRAHGLRQALQRRCLRRPHRLRR